MAQTKPKAGQFYGVSNNGTDGQFLKTDGTGGMSWDSPITNPTITSIDYPGTATAADPAGGESVIINGTLFASGVTCTVGGTSAVTAFNSANQITITTPAKAAGQYTVAITNLDGGTASQANFIQYSGVPVWSTASGSLGSVQEGATASFQVTATEGSDTIEYAVTTGSLPSGLSLNTNTGAITGTAGSVSASTTTTFSITATDDENQTSSARSFNITVTPDFPSNHFNTVLYTGNGSTQAITGVGFAPDLIWIKARNASCDHSLTDSIRGVSKILSSNSTSAEGNQSPNGVTAFGSDGFSVTDVSSGGSSVNGAAGGSCSGNPPNYVAWNFKAGGAAVANNVGTTTSQVSANNTLGFSTVSYTGAGVVNVGHGLSSSPDLIISKITNASSDWVVYNSVSGTGKYLVLNSGASTTTDAGVFPSVTNSTFTHEWSGNSYQYINYCFTSKPGFSKVGSYTGNGSANGPIVQTGFEPAFLMIKRTDSSANWRMLDNKRSTTNPIDKELYPNLSNSEGTFSAINFYTNGFENISTDASYNATGGTYIYLAFAADPSTTTPSLANSFDTTLWSNGVNQHQSPITGVGFKPDLTWIKSRNSGTDHVLTDSVRGVTKTLFSNLTSNEVTVAQGLTAFNSDGFALGNDSRFNPDQRNQVSWNWKAGGTPSINTDGSTTSIVSVNDAAGFSIVKFQTDATSVVGHGLSSAPELVIVKRTDSSSSWFVYNTVASGAGRGFLNTTSVFDNSGVPTFNASTVSFQTSDPFNAGVDVIMYCFTSISGYSKVGSYVGTGGSISAINVGFAPGFVMIKGLGNSGNWVMLDNKRGGTSRDQLDANDSHAEYANQGVTFTSTGFSPRQTLSSDTNTSGITYIYLAIKEN